MAQRKGNKASEADEIIDVVEVKGSQVSAGNFFEQNQKTISYVLMGLAILAALYYGYKHLYMGPREKEAVNAMYKAEEQFAKDSFALALENPGGGFDGFLGIIDNFSGTKAANLAQYYAGISYLNLGKYEDAIQYLDDYSANDDVTAVMKNGALGDANAELGDKAKAMDYYQKAAKAENDMLPEDILSDQNIAPGDRIIITDESGVNTVTTRERIKFLMRGNVYELAVKTNLN